jgi:hypothetical protein
MPGRRWTPAEDAEILASRLPDRVLARKLGRSKAAIANRRGRLRQANSRIPRKGEWSTQELNALGSAPPSVSNAELARRLGRTEYAVSWMRPRVSPHTVRRRRWSDQELQVLAGDGSMAEMLLRLPGRTLKAIWNRKTKLNKERRKA